MGLRRGLRAVAADGGTTRVHGAGGPVCLFSILTVGRWHAERDLLAWTLLHGRGSEWRAIARWRLLQKRHNGAQSLDAAFRGAAVKEVIKTSRLEANPRGSCTMQRCG